MVKENKRYFLHPAEKEYVSKEVYFEFLFGSDYLSSDLKGSIKEYKDNYEI